MSLTWPKKLVSLPTSIATTDSAMKHAHQNDFHRLCWAKNGLKIKSQRQCVSSEIFNMPIPSPFFPPSPADSPPAKKARNPPEDGDKPTGPRSPVEPPPPTTSSSSCEGELMRPLLETVQALLRALTQGERPAASS